MAYKKVTREEFERYMASNPSGAYRVNGQEVRPEKTYADEEDQSGLMKLLTNLSRPLRAVGGSVAEAINSKGGYDNPFLTEREEDNFREDPTKWGTKQASSLAAYLIPGGSTAGTAGKRIMGAAAKGAGAGAFGGFGASDDENELESILKGAGLGSLLGGGLQAGGEGIKALKNIKADNKITQYMSKQRGEAIGLDANKLAKSRSTGISSATDGEVAIDKFFNSMDELGYKPRTSEMASRSADEALSKYGSNFKNLLKTADSNMSFTGADTASIWDDVVSKVGNNDKIMNASTVKELSQDLASLGNNYTPSQLNLIREKAREAIKWNRTGVTPNTERGVKAIFDSIDDFFKGSIPQSEEVLSKMSNIYTVRPFIQGKAIASGKVPVGTISTHINIPTGGLDEVVQSGVGELGSKLQTGSMGTGMESIGNILGGLGQATQRVAPAMASQIGGQPQQAPIQPQQQPQSQGVDSETQAIQMAMAQAIYSGQITADEAEAIMGYLGINNGMSGGGDLTEKQRMFVAAGQAADEALNILESGEANTGKLQNVGSFFGRTFGTQDPMQTTYESKLDAARSAALSALSGANIPPAEYERMAGFIPEPTDEYNIAVAKLKSFRDEMSRYAYL